MLFIATANAPSYLVDLQQAAVVREYGVGSSRQCAVAYCAASDTIAIHQDRLCVLFVTPHAKQIVQRSFTSDTVGCCAVSSCGTWMLAGTIHGNLLVWNLHTGQLVCSRKMHSRQITCVAINCDVSLVATASADATCRVWRTAALVNPAKHSSTEAVARSGSANEGNDASNVFMGHTLAVNCCAFCNTHSRYVVTGSADLTCRIFDAQTCMQLYVFTIGEPVMCLATDAADRWLVAGMRGGALCFAALSPVFAHAHTQHGDDAHKGMIIIHVHAKASRQRSGSGDEGDFFDGIACLQFSAGTRVGDHCIGDAPVSNARWCKVSAATALTAAAAPAACIDAQIQSSQVSACYADEVEHAARVLVVSKKGAVLWFDAASGRLLGEVVQLPPCTVQSCCYVPHRRQPQAAKKGAASSGVTFSKNVVDTVMGEGCMRLLVTLAWHDDRAEKTQKGSIRTNAISALNVEQQDEASAREEERQHTHTSAAVTNSQTSEPTQKLEQYMTANDELVRLLHRLNQKINDIKTSKASTPQ